MRCENPLDCRTQPDGKTIASGGEDKTITLWDINQGSLLRTLEGHFLNIWSVAFSPDSSRLASGSFDRKIKIWNFNDGQLIKTLEGHTQAVLSVAFSKDGQFLVRGGRDRNIVGEFIQKIFGASDSSKWVTVRLWNVEDGKLIQTFAHHSNDVFSVAFSPDGKWIVTAGEDKSVSILQLTR